jgi:UDP-N-acetylmuramoyl-L-alanyl-D-glutamate--2,6-diaminopimelate ligase
MHMSAIKKLARKVIPKSTIKKAEKAYRKQKAVTANTIYGKPAKNLKVIAVTGTNGKTTTCAFINSVIKAAGLKTAVYTTAFIEINGIDKPNKSHMTVASAWSVQQFMSRAKKADVDWVILEVTSHALDQYRIYGVPVKIAAVTNISQDHLDYHGTMQNYADAKARLITDFKPDKVLLNADDDWYGFFANKVKQGLATVGKNKASYQIKAINLKPSGTSYTLVCSRGVVDIKTRLVGDFNVYNTAMAAIIGQMLDIDNRLIQKGISDVPIVPGRMEPIEAGQPFTVLVDYAVTPDAIKCVLEAVRSLTKGRVRLVFGATGDRDKSKRPIMGQVAAKFADYIYLTDDETYSENGDLIRQAVKKGIIESGGTDKFVEIADRRLAIKQAFKDALAGDVVILAGIGHQDYRNQGGKRIPWDERIVAKELLQEIY